MGRTQRVSFAGSEGRILAGRLDEPHGDPIGYAVFSHCFTCTKDLKSINRISRACAEGGLGVLRFDFAGLGESEGDFAATNFTTNVEDIRAAVDFLERQQMAPGLLIGHSLGGAAMIVAAGQLPEVRGVAVIGTPSHTGHLAELLVQQRPHFGAEQESPVVIGGQSYTLRRQLVEDLAQQDLPGAVRHLGKPLLVFHSPADETVEVEEGEQIFASAVQPKSFIALSDADHLLIRNPADIRYVAEILLAWGRRYLAASD